MNLEKRLAQSMREVTTGDTFKIQVNEETVVFEVAYVEDQPGYRMASMAGDDIRLWLVRDQFMYATDKNNEHIDDWEWGKNIDGDNGEVEFSRST